MNDREKDVPAPTNFDVAQSSGSASGTESEARPANEGIKPVNKLTPEEQMALFEKELKENDWGHQPC